MYSQLTKDVIFVPEPFARIAEQRGNGHDETLQIHETSLGAVELDQNGDDASTHLQV